MLWGWCRHAEPGRFGQVRHAVYRFPHLGLVLAHQVANSILKALGKEELPQPKKEAPKK